MSVFSSIMHKIFNMGAQAAPAGASGGQQSTAPAGGGSAGPAGQTSAPSSVSGGAVTGAAAPSGGASASGAAAGSVDVEAVLNGLASKSGQQLNWRTSIVDLMKLLDLDSSLANRKELAQELHYTGDTNDSATMNVWLHKQVMQKLAENGGKVPADLRG
jgi:hypothetical protein